MAKQTLTNARLLFGEYDITGYANKVGLDVEADMKDKSVFGETWKSSMPGVLKCTVSASGYQDDDIGSAMQPDAAIFGSINAAGRVFLVSPDGGDENEKAFFVKGLTGNYQCFGAHGELAPWSMNLAGAGASGYGGIAVMGTILRDATCTTTENGTALQLGSVTSTQHLYGVLHVTGVTALTTMTVKIQSDDNEAFTSATDRITFTAATGVTNEWAVPIAGEIADDWWRAIVSVFTGTNATYTVAMGIQ